MPSVNPEAVSEQILRILESILDIPKTKISMEDRIIKDLGMASDDATYVFIPQVQETFHIKIDPKKWLEVVTVRDVVDLVNRG